jgi:hypothetical protein
MSLKNQPAARTTISLLLLLLAALLPLLPAQPAHAQDVPIVYEHFNTEMTLSEDGVLHVRLIQQIRFDGSFSGAFYAVPIRNVTSIDNLQIFRAATESGNYELNTVDLLPVAPNFIENNGEEIAIDWDFPTTRPGDVRLFIIEYDAYGVVWVYPERDFISWKAVNEDRSGVAVEESTVKLTLPEMIPMEAVTTTSNLASQAPRVTGQTLTFTADGPIPDGTPFEIEAYFPHGLLDVGVR